MHRVLFAFCIILFTVSAEQGAKKCQSGLKYDMIESIMKANVVVYGQHIGQNEDSRDVYFEIYCVMKTGGMNIPSNITILDAVPENECSPTQMELGKKYIVMLIDHADIGRDKYKLDEDHDSSAAFDATSQNLTDVANACNMQENQRLKMPDDHDPTAAGCPKRTVTDDTCLQLVSSTGSCKTLASGLVYVYAVCVIMRLFL